jgi:hypothetical protein
VRLIRLGELSFGKVGGPKEGTTSSNGQKYAKAKKKGGVGIKNLTSLNISLLSKWWWKLEWEDGLWQDLVKAKYLAKDSIHTVSHKLHDSPMWSDLLKVKDLYLRGRTIKIGKWIQN